MGTEQTKPNNKGPGPQQQQKIKNEKTKFIDIHH